jgi:hypothetical protein
LRRPQADTLVSKLLSTDHGKAALSQALGGAQIVDKEEDIRPIVAVLMPSRDNPQLETQKAFEEMVAYSRSKAIVWNATSFSGASIVHFARNMLIANLIKSGKPWDYVLFMDDDMVPERDSLVKLLSHQREIVGALCTKRTDPPLPNIRYFDENTGDFSEILDWGTDGLIEVDAVGTGMILISKKALEEIADAYFKCRYEKKFLGMPDSLAEHFQAQRLRAFDTINANGWWFRNLLHMKDGNSEYGEDVSFCVMAKMICSIPVYCDTTVRPGHLGKYPFSVADFLPYREMVLEKAKEAGKLKELATA